MAMPWGGGREAAECTAVLPLIRRGVAGATTYAHHGMAHGRRQPLAASCPLCCACCVRSHVPGPPQLMGSRHGHVRERRAEVTTRWPTGTDARARLPARTRSIVQSTLLLYCCRSSFLAMRRCAVPRPIPSGHGPSPSSPPHRTSAPCSVRPSSSCSSASCFLCIHVHAHLLERACLPPGQARPRGWTASKQDLRLRVTPSQYLPSLTCSARGAVPCPCGTAQRLRSLPAGFLSSWPRPPPKRRPAAPCVQPSQPLKAPNPGRPATSGHCPASKPCHSVLELF